MKKRIGQTMISLALLAVMLFASAPGARAEDADTAAQFVKKLRVGWNLGNALDTTDYKKQGIDTVLTGRTPEELYETLWGNPVTTRGMIKTVADAGFGAVRVPVTYYDHMDSAFRISESWLDRVEEVVGYVLDSGLYCIINLHHDAGNGTWLRADPDRIGEMKAKMATVWKQIAERFKDYDERLVFESFNEILDSDDRWTNAGVKAYGAVNELNQTFVDTVRATGGQNAARYLTVKSYAASVNKDALEAFVLPEDTAEDRLIVSVHTYVPPPFTHLRNDEQSNVNAQSGATFYEILDRLDKLFIQRGTPVIIAEFCARNKNNTAARVDYAKEFVGAAAKYGIACFWWDDGGSTKLPEEVKNYGLMDRQKETWWFPVIVEALTEAAVFPAAEENRNVSAQPTQSASPDTPRDQLRRVDRLALLIVFGLITLIAANVIIAAAVVLIKRRKAGRRG